MVSTNQQDSATHYIRLGERRYVVSVNPGGMYFEEDHRGTESGGGKGLAFPSLGGAFFCMPESIDTEGRREVVGELESVSAFLQDVAHCIRGGDNMQDAVRNVITYWWMKDEDN